MTSFLEVVGCRIAFDDVGSGRTVLFSHGAGADRHMFDAQVPVLVEAGYRVITWDLRGHGDSRPNHEPVTAHRLVADLLELCRHLGLERPVLVGQSLGGNLSQEVIRREPQLAAGLVVIDSAWNTAPLTGLERMLLRIAAPALSLVPASRLPQLMADASASTPAGRDYAVEAFGRMRKADFIEVWRATTAFLDPDPGYRTPVPLMLLRGDLDRTGTIATSMPRWADAEGVHDVVIPGAAHLANVDSPNRVSAELLRFLGGLA